jgi:membrane-bound lytic murein transglycosylase B
MNKNREFFSNLCFGLTLITGMVFQNHQAYADQALLKHQDAQSFINEMVQQHHFKKNDLQALLTNAQYQPKIIESITKPYEKKSWDVYKDIFIKPERVQEGIAFWKANRETLAQAEKKYGVPANMIVAILGVETRWGLRQGEYRVLDALSTLAFYYPPRAAFFRKELGEYLLLCREHGVSPTQYLGSYAGAMGKPQFMPSSYRYYADDFMGSKKKDLMNDNQAAIASVANYFQKHGWKLNQEVVQPAVLGASAHHQLNFSLKNAEYSTSTLKKMGVQPIAPLQTNFPSKAGVIQLDREHGGHEYWVAYPNFYVITKYNSSPQYALVVYLLSQQLQQQWAKINQAQQHAFG